MSARNDGGPAFPNPYIESDPLQTGMTLRDWFAGHALANEGAGSFRWSQKMRARLAYEQADAMLAARANVDEVQP